MSFLLRCPQCGPRDVYEFRWGGEQSERPAPDSPGEAWTSYLYLRRNEAGTQQEWWYHRAGCRRWFLAVRDTRVNRVEKTFWPTSSSERGSAPLPSPPPGVAPAKPADSLRRGLEAPSSLPQESIAPAKPALEAAEPASAQEPSSEP